MSFVTGIPLKSIEKLIQASFSVARTIVPVKGVPNQCFPYLNFLGASAQVFWVVWVLGSFLYLAIMTLFCFKNALQRVSRKGCLLVQIYEQQSAKKLKYRIVILMLGLLDKKTEDV